MSKLIIISEFIDPKQNSTGYYWHKLIEGLSTKFENIHVVCPDSSFQRLEKPNPRVNYVQFTGSEIEGKKLHSRLIKQLLLAFHLSRALLRTSEKGDVVFSGTNPSFMLLFLSVLKLFSPFKWVLLVHDVFPENLVAANIVKRNGIAIRLLKYIFDKVYGSADRLISIGRDMQELLVDKIGDSERVAFIPNWVDKRDVDIFPREKCSSLLGEGEPGTVVFQFFGNIGRVQGVDNLLDGIQKSLSKNARFVFIGGGAEQEKVKAFVEKGVDCRVRYISNLPFEKNNLGLAACDVAIASLSEGMNGLGVPSKAYFSIAADKPVLVVTDKGSELCRMVEENENIGWFCEAGDPEALARVIDDICCYDFEMISGQPRALLEAKYEYWEAINQYNTILSEFINMNPSIDYLGEKEGCGETDL